MRALLATCLVAVSCAHLTTTDPYRVRVDVSRDIRALGSDDLDVQDEATVKLLAFGADVLPALEAAPVRECVVFRARFVLPRATMPVDIAALVHPGHSALITQECQRGVIGDRSLLPALAAAAAPMIPRLARLASAARRAGVRVVHCTATRRPDGLGSNRNARLFMATRGSAMVPGSVETEIVPEIGVAESDLVVPRIHGVSPMHGTELDPILRNLGVKTIVAVGVSVNVALTNLVFDAVNASYQVVVPRDAVAGLPAAYVDAVFENTLGLLATVTTTEELAALWERAT